MRENSTLLFHVQQRIKDLYATYETWKDDLFVVRLPPNSDIVPWGPTIADERLHVEHFVPLQKLCDRVQWESCPDGADDMDDEDGESADDADSAYKDEASLLDKMDAMDIVRAIQDSESAADEFQIESEQHSTLNGSRTTQPRTKVPRIS